MKAQFDNQVMSSFLLWFDHTLLNKGDAYQNTTGQFYSVSDDYFGYDTYASSYSQFVSDASITGATIPTGLYAGNTLVNVGEGGSDGLYAIDYGNGRSYWSGTQSSNVTGSFAIKDFNVYLTSRTEDEILFQSQYTNRNKISSVVPTGLEPDTLTYPVVYIKNDGSNNEPFAFGGQDNTIINVRAIVIADSQFDIDAIGSLFRDRRFEQIGILEPSEMPFNQFGYYRSSQYDYTGIVNGKGSDQQLYVDNTHDLLH